MKASRIASITGLFFFAFLLFQSPSFLSPRASVREATNRERPKQTPLSDRAALRAAGRGNPWIDLRDGIELIAYLVRDNLLPLPRQGTITVAGPGIKPPD